MENATKALLIAAAVLITIVLISVAILLIQNIGDTKEQAQEVGNMLGQATGNASNNAIGGIKGAIISKRKFNDFINDFNAKYPSSNKFMNTILNVQNAKLGDQIQIIGYMWQDTTSKLDSEKPQELKELGSRYDKTNHENNKEYYEYVINKWIPELLMEGKLKPINDPLDKAERKAKYKEVYRNKKGVELTDEELNSKNRYMDWAFTYDQWGYINTAVFIASMNF